MTQDCIFFLFFLQTYLGTLLLLLVGSENMSAQRYTEDRPPSPESNPAALRLHPQDEQPTYKPRVYEVRSQIAPNIGDGNFQYYVETSDGLQAEQIGYVGNKPQPSQVHEGAYTTFDESGKVVLVNYVADKDGFRVSGESLPTPPPIPPEHVKAREDILKQQEEIRNMHLANFRAAHAAYGRKY